MSMVRIWRYINRPIIYDTPHIDVSTTGIHRHLLHATLTTSTWSIIMMSLIVHSCVAGMLFLFYLFSLFTTWILFTVWWEEHNRRGEREDEKGWGAWEEKGRCMGAPYLAWCTTAPPWKMKKLKERASNELGSSRLRDGCACQMRFHCACEPFHH